jgi:hypothetical protein
LAFLDHKPDLMVKGALPQPHVEISFQPENLGFVWNAGASVALFQTESGLAFEMHSGIGVKQQPVGPARAGSTQRLGSVTASVSC